MEEIFFTIGQFITNFIVGLVSLIFLFPLEFLFIKKWISVKTILVIVGCVIGGVSVWIYPDHIITTKWLRSLNIIITPAFLAAFFQWLEKKLTGIEKIHIKDYTFWDVYLFALAFTVVRYIFAQ